MTLSVQKRAQALAMVVGAASLTLGSARASDLEPAQFQPRLAIEVNFGHSTPSLTTVSLGMQPVTDGQGADFHALGRLQASEIPASDLVRFSVADARLVEARVLGHRFSSSGADALGVDEGEASGSGSWLWWAVGGVVLTVGAVAALASDDDEEEGDRMGTPFPGPPDCPGVQVGAVCTGT